MAKTTIADIKIGKRHRKELGDLNGLKASIEDIGLLHPIVIDETGKLIVGRRRLEACKQLGHDRIEARRVDLAEIVQAEADENGCRLDFTPSESVAIGKAIKAREQKAAREREKAGKPSLNFNKGRATEKVGQAVGMSYLTYERAEELVDAAKAEPEKYQPLVDEMDKTGRVNGAYKKYKTAQTAEQIDAEPPPLPKGPFRVIVADPPWSYSNRAADASHRAANPYPPEPLEDIKAKPVEGMAHKNAILWLWTTNAFMREAYEVADAWGFTVKTILTWAKDRMGTGDWLRGQTEHCLMCVRGKPTVKLTNQTTLLHGPMREHSRKPEEFYELVEALCPGSKCEMYQQTKRKGWEGHGAELGKFKT